MKKIELRRIVISTGKEFQAEYETKKKRKTKKGIVGNQVKEKRTTERGWGGSQES